MFKCRKMRGLIAASVYETLPDRDEGRLRNHLAFCSSCRELAEVLTRTVRQIPSESPTLGYNLLPTIRERIEERTYAPWQRPVRLGLAAMACCLAIFVALQGFRGFAPQSSVPAKSGIADSDRDVSAMESALVAAAKQARDKQFTAAYKLLSDALDHDPKDANAGKAQDRLADIAFSDLGWYPQAYAAYEKLARDYPETLRASQEAVWRRNLLAEAREKDFAALYAIEAAARGGADAFGKLEQVVCSNPGTFTASHASERMASLVLNDTPVPEGENPHLFAMAKAREKCSQPVASVQFTLEMGLICWQELNETGRARDLFNEAANDAHTVLAQREFARQSLAQLAQP